MTTQSSQVLFIFSSLLHPLIKFHLFLLIIYTFYSVAYYKFSLGYNRSIRHCSVLLFFKQVWKRNFTLTGNKSLQISRAILADFSSAVVLIFSVLSLISGSPSLFFRFLETVERVLTTVSFTFTCDYFGSLARSKYLLKIRFLWFSIR